MAERPTGVTIISILYFIGGIGSIIGGVVFTAVSGFLANIPLFGALAGAASAVLFILGIVELVIGWGLLKGKNWARIIAIILGIIGILGSLGAIVSGAFASVIVLIIDIIIVWYLFKPRVKEFFR